MKQQLSDETIDYFMGVVSELATSYVRKLKTELPQVFTNENIYHASQEAALETIELKAHCIAIAEHLKGQATSPKLKRDIAAWIKHIDDRLKIVYVPSESFDKANAAEIN